MNMPAFKFFLLIVILSALLCACKKEITQNVNYSNVIYEVNPVDIYADNSEKDKQKTAEQFISILYSDLFNESIPGSALNDLSEVINSVGDKGLANEMLLENMLNAQDVVIPTDGEMRSNIDQFVEDTYIRFFLRVPSAYEKLYFTALIEEDVNLKPEMIYAAFATSNEYLFY